MAITTDIRRTLDTPAVYALVGATDLAVEKVRGVQARLTHLLEPRAVADDVRARVTSLGAQASEVPVKATVKALQLTGQALEAYDDLVERGRTVAGRVATQEASQELEAQLTATARRTRAARDAAEKGATQTARAAKETTATVRKSAARTTRKTKAAASEAAKTAEVAAKAAQDGVEQLG
ncbi:MAG: hypothetical protein M3Q27_01125 [Actinomycetota bacterium]|nr:hypothetical protein [Actinomycetota bacterium]